MVYMGQAIRDDIKILGNPMGHSISIFLRLNCERFCETVSKLAETEKKHNHNTFTFVLIPLSKMDDNPED